MHAGEGFPSVLAEGAGYRFFANEGELFHDAGILRDVSMRGAFGGNNWGVRGKEGWGGEGVV